ncbi:hypothetical protein VTI74DRAFT_6287 [Chaetomium olivicolor]
MSRPSRPPIPLQMAGGRPQPGSTLRRPGIPTPFEFGAGAAAAPAPVATDQGNASTLAASPSSATGTGGGRASLAGYDFTFASEVVAGAAVPGGGGLGSAFAPRSSPAPASRQGGGSRAGFAGATASRADGGIRARDAAGGGRSSFAAAAAAARRRSRALHTATGCVASGGTGSAGGLWGQAFLVGSSGQFRFEASERMDEWLDRLRALSLTGDNETGLAAIEAQNMVHERANFESNASARTGDKRSAPSDQHDDDDNEEGISQPASKRSRVGNVFQRAISRFGGHSRAAGGNNMSKMAAATTTGAPSVSASAAGNTFAQTSVVARALSPFNALSRAGSALGMGAVASASQAVPRRKLNVCLVGEVAAGKSAFFNRLVSDSFFSTSPSMAPDFKSLNVRVDDGSIVTVELWDFPGIVAGQRAGPLLSTFFHAAIICFSLEDKDNLKAISEVWKPKLDACLHDQDTFVLGLKSDLRPSHPTLSLSFLPPTKEPVSFQMGEQAAVAIDANCYGECSAKTNAHVQFVWESLISYTVERLDKYERTIGNGCRREKAKAAVARVFKGLDPFSKGKQAE